jgi:hypothetical protein
MLPLHTSLTVGQPALRRGSKHRATTTTATRAVAPTRWARRPEKPGS